MTETVSEQSDRPAIIKNAVKLLLATLGIGVVRSILEFNTLAKKVPGSSIPMLVGFTFFVWAFVFGLLLFLIYKIENRRNWARITFLVLFIIGLPFSALPLLQSLSATPVSGLLGILQMAGQISALVMLFQERSNAWYRKPTTA